MHILIAPNCMKGSLDAASFARAIAAGLRKTGGPFRLTMLPVADGGDGTAGLLAGYVSAREFVTTVKDPAGRDLHAKWYLGGETAIMDVASASGLALLETVLHDPLNNSSFGTGQLIDQAVDQGARKIILGLGGSATVDGGTGCLEALGFSFFDNKGRSIPACGAKLEKIKRITLPPAEKLSGLSLTLLCDVLNPLCGPLGAARVFAPQKGAGPGATVQLERGLENWSMILKEWSEGAWDDHAMCGAAGGMAAGMEVLTGATLLHGAEYFLDYTGFDSLLEEADVVITGEGSLDSQTGHMKAPMEVALRASSAGKQVIGIAGKITDPPAVFQKTYAFQQEGMSLDYCMENAAILAEEAAFRAGLDLLASRG